MKVRREQKYHRTHYDRLFISEVLRGLLDHPEYSFWCLEHLCGCLILMIRANFERLFTEVS